MELPNKKYLLFFKDKFTERLLFLKGGRRSGKTYAILYYFMVLAKRGEKEGPLIVTYEYPQLSTLMIDFENATGIEPHRSSLRCEYIAEYKGCLFRFRSFDNEMKAKGTKCKRLWINEGDSMPEEIYKMLTLGVEKQIIVDHNPTHHFWGTYLQNENNTLSTTYEDNTYLPESQIAEFKEVERKGLIAEIGTMDWIVWQRLIRGNYAEKGGIIFEKVFQITENQFDNIELDAWVGCDLGDVVDPNVAMLVKINFESKELYCKELYYKSKESDDDMIYSLENHSFRNFILPPDTGYSKRFSRFSNTFKSNGWKLIIAYKTSVAASIYDLAGYTIYICGSNAYKEFTQYRSENGKFTGQDHAIDAVRYVHILMKNKQKTIKNTKN